jgi:DNA-binding NtrC family response regulator
MIPLVGSGNAITALRERITRIAATDFTVMVEGASGPHPHPIPV